MGQMYQLLPWLSASDAAQFASQLTNQNITVEKLNQLCGAGYCNAYIRCQGIKGVEDGSYRNVCADDAQILVFPENLRCAVVEDENQKPIEVLSISRPLVYGPVWVYPHEDKPAHSEDNVTWALTTGDNTHYAMFKPADIEALAAKVNGTALSSSTDSIESLRQQLEQEHAARLSAEAEVAQLRQELPLLNSHIGASPSSATITFPYKTKQLEILCAAAVQFWSTHDVQAPAPYARQKIVQSYLTEKIGIARTVELARAILPDDLPKA